MAGYIFGGDTGVTAADLAAARAARRATGSDPYADLSTGLASLGNLWNKGKKPGEVVPLGTTLYAPPPAAAPQMPDDPIAPGAVAGPGGGGSPAPNAAPLAAVPPTPEIVARIQQEAKVRGIDPGVALKVAYAEGLTANPNEGWQSRVRSSKTGKRETSYGPYQLLVGGGLGDEFMRTTGLDPRDPRTVYAQIAFALETAKRKGWGDWYGARDNGISNWEGIR